MSFLEAILQQGFDGQVLSTSGKRFLIEKSVGLMIFFIGGFWMAVGMAPPAVAQTWYLRHDLTEMLPPRGNPDEYIVVNERGFSANFTVPGMGATLTAQWSLPPTLTTSGSAIPLAVQISGPDPYRSEWDNWGPYFNLMLEGHGEQPARGVNDGYSDGEWNAAEKQYLFFKGQGPYVPSDVVRLEGPNPMWTEITYEIQLSGYNWSEHSTDGVNVFYTYSRDPAPEGDVLTITSSRPANGDIIPADFIPEDGGAPANRLVEFEATVQYRLRSRAEATIGMYVFDQAGLIVAETATFFGVARGTNLATATLATADVVIPATSSNLYLVAYFVDGSPPDVFMRSNTNRFSVGRGMRLELGNLVGGVFVPIGPLNDRYLVPGSLDRQSLEFTHVRVTRIPALDQDDVLETWGLDQDLYNGVPNSKRWIGKSVPIPKIPPSEVVLSVDYFDVSMGTDEVQVNSVLRRKGAMSNLVRLPVQFTQVFPKSPRWSEELTAGSTAPFEMSIRYNVCETTPIDLIRRTSYNAGDGSGHYPAVVMASGLKKGDRRFTNEAFNVALPNNIDRLYFDFALGNDPRCACLTSYFNFKKTGVQIPAQSVSPIPFPGGILKPNANPQDRSLVIDNFGCAIATLMWLQPRPTPRKQPAPRLAETMGPRVATPANGYLSSAEFLGIPQVWGFDPPISAGSGFVAELSLSWKTNAVPDDPNFDLNRVEMVSWNEGDVFLRRHPTTLDLGTRTATAAIDGLDRYYSLGVAGPFAWRVLNAAPLASPDGNTAAEQVLNPGRWPMPCELDCFNEGGEGVGAPVSLSMANQAVRAGPLAPEWGLEAFGGGHWVQATAPESSGAALSLEFGDADRREWFAASYVTTPRMVFPFISAGSQGSAELHLVNPSSFDAQAQFVLFQSNGLEMARTQIDLPAKGKRAASVRELFPLLPVLEQASHAVVECAVGLNGWLRLSAPDYLAGIQGISIVPDRDGDPLVAPQVKAGGSVWKTSLAVVNMGEASAALDATALDANGNAIGGPVALTIAPGARMEWNLTELFGWDGSTETNFTLIVTGQTGRVAAALDVADAMMIGMERYRTLGPLEFAKPGGLVFPVWTDVGQSEIVVAVHNSSTQALPVAVSLFQTNGNLAAVSRRSILPHHTERHEIRDWFPATAVTGTHYLVVAGNDSFNASALTFARIANEFDGPAWVSTLPSTRWPQAEWGPLLSLEKQGSGWGLHWPQAETGMVAQLSEKIGSSANWLPLTGTPIATNAHYWLGISATNRTGYFRLTRP